MAQKGRHTPYCNLINFIPETGGTNLIANKTESAHRKKNIGDNVGLEIKSFYENLVNDKTCEKYTKKVRKRKTRVPTSDNSGSATKRRKQTSSKNNLFSQSPSNNSSQSQFFVNSCTIDPCQRQHFKLLQCSQSGDERKVKELLDNGLDVNFKDFFGWTPLMCAAKEGHSTVIELLLKHGADKSLQNSVGDTALVLALNSSCSDVVRVLENYDTTGENATTNERLESNSSSEAFYCDVCKREFSQREEASHLTSTVHLFNSGRRSKGPAYFIPDSNRGFQMMLRSGWDAQSGLGPDGKGFKYPVKTVLKQDRAGLGGEDAKKKKAKVTHFERGDVDAVKYQKNPTRQISVRKAARNAAKTKQRKDRRWEQNLRFELS